jgi:hypothetical protein
MCQLILYPEDPSLLDLKLRIDPHRAGLGLIFYS